MSGETEVLLRAVDRRHTYLAWRWLDRPDEPDYVVVDGAAAAAAGAALESALFTPLRGETGAEAVHRALVAGAFADPDRERALARSLTDAFLPDRLRAQIRDRWCAGARVRVRVTPSPRLARVPWELLWIDARHRLIDAATVVHEPPAVVHAGRARAPENWQDVRDRPALLVIDPEVPSSAAAFGLNQALSTGSLEPFAQRIGDYIAAGRARADDRDLAMAPIFTRRDLAEALAIPRSRLLYFGHASASPDEPGSAAVHLSDTAAIWGLAAPLVRPGSTPSAGDHRPFAAIDLLLGTTTGDEHARRTYGIEPRSGPDLWPMPPRVALIACESGVDYRSAEMFGLVVAMVNAGAALVTSTRWTLPTDDSLRQRAGRDPATRPTTDLTLRVDAAHEEPDPVEDLARWQRAQLAAWSDGACDAMTPLVWASITNTVAPRRPSAHRP
ncbi:CHAT domain-containing protein [Nocardia vaccinii]|uniref:CHAT domain-containing protein n=1 Tax=Nocardia vaccinii TaxID=1822 RepID=UPI00083302C0|nr:CHAT domain-containing protein [Nocardia vaccinii]